MPRPPIRRVLSNLLAAASLIGLAHGDGNAAVAAVPAAAVPEGEVAAVAGVRAGRHPGFDRLVVEWPGPVRPEVVREDDAVRLRFPHAVRLDLAGVAGQLGRHIIGVETAQEDGVAVLVARSRPGTAFRVSALDRRRIVLDAAPMGGAVAPAAPAPRVAVVPPLHPATAAPARPAPRSATRAAAPAGVDGRAVELLQQELYRRDLMIASLLQRVERLERSMPLGERPPEEQALSDRPLDEVIAGLTPSAERVVVAQAGRASAGPAAAPATAARPEERALERVLARDGTLLLRPGEAEIEPEFSFTRRKDSAPVFVTDGGTSFFIGEDEVRRKEYTGSLALRFGLPLDSQLEVSLPYRYVDQSNVTELGFGEVRAIDADGHGAGDLVLAAAKTVTQQKGWRPDVVARAWWDTRTGETRDNRVPLGGGFNELGVAVSALRRQDPLAFFAALSYETTLEQDRVDPGDEVGLRLGAALAVSPETSLRFSLDQRFAQEAEVGGNEIGGSDRSVATLSLDAASVLGRGVLVDVGFDIGLTDDAPDYTARVSVPIRFDLPVF